MREVSQTTVALVAGIASGLCFGAIGYCVGLVLQDMGSVTPSGYMSPWGFALTGFIITFLFVSLLILSIPEHLDVRKLISKLFKKKQAKEDEGK
jgi:hypothetical protein